MQVMTCEFIQQIGAYPADMPVIFVARTYQSVLLYSSAVEVGKMSVVMPAQTLTMVFDGVQLTPRNESIIKLQEDEDSVK